MFVLIFTYFNVPEKYQHRVLFWGIIGALVLRGVMIVAGSALVTRFAWTLFIFGAFLVFTGLKMALQKDQSVYDLERDPLLRLARRVIPIADDYHGDKFFVRQPVKGGGTRLAATQLFIVLIIVDTTDVIFAMDSIPAIFAVTRDPFIVYTSNICAVLGLRALYFLLAGVVDKFVYLKLGLSLVLVFIGGKMLLEHFVHLPIVASLGVVGAVLAASIVASFQGNPGSPQGKLVFQPVDLQAPERSPPEVRAARQGSRCPELARGGSPPIDRRREGQQANGS